MHGLSSGGVFDMWQREGEPEHAVAGLSEWGEQVSRAIARFSMSSADPQRFRGRVRVHTADGIRLVDMESDRHTALRTPILEGRHESQLYVASMHVSGAVHVEYAGRGHDLEPGDLGIYSTSAPVRVESGDGFHGISLVVPRSLLRVPSESLARLEGARIRGDNVLAIGLGGLMVSFNQSLDSVAPAYRSRVMHGMVDLLVTLMLSETDTAQERYEQRCVRARLRNRMYRYIEEHLSDPELDVTRVAEAHYVSARYVHNLFHDTETTPAEWIRAKRIDHARRDLAAPEHRGIPAGKIGMRWGFSSPSHFGRVFKQVVGVSPNAYRRSVLGPLVVPLPSSSEDGRLSGLTDLASAN